MTDERMSKAAAMENEAGKAVRARFLRNPPFLWCWDLEDTTGRRVESSWEDHWDAFSCSEQAHTAGLARLHARMRAAGAKAAARTATLTGAVALVIVERGEAALYESLTGLFRAREEIVVIRDRRSGERRQRGHDRQPLERRRNERRRRSDVDAQIRTRGWSVLSVPQGGHRPQSKANSLAGSGSRCSGS